MVSEKFIILPKITMLIRGGEFEFKSDVSTDALTHHDILPLLTGHSVLKTRGSEDTCHLLPAPPPPPISYKGPLCALLGSRPRMRRRPESMLTAGVSL